EVEPRRDAADIGHQLVDLALARMVAAEQEAFAAERRNLARGLLDRLGPPVGRGRCLGGAPRDDHLGTGLAERERHAAPDPARGAGDQGCAAGERAPDMLLARGVAQEASASAASCTEAAPLVIAASMPGAPVAIFSAKKRASATRPASAGSASPFAA